MTVRAMDHFTIVTDQLAETIAFYAMLGLSDGPRWNICADPPVWVFIRQGVVATLHAAAVAPTP